MLQAASVFCACRIVYLFLIRILQHLLTVSTVKTVDFVHFYFSIREYFYAILFI